MGVKLLKRWLSVLVLLVIAFVLKSKLPFLTDALTVIRQVHPGWTALGVLGTFGALVAMAAVMVVLPRAGGVSVSLPAATRVVLTANSWSATMPGGQAFAAVFSFNAMTAWGASRLLATWQIIVSGAMSTSWLIGLAVTAMIVAGTHAQLTSLLVTDTAMVALSLLLYWAMQHPQRVVV